MKDLAKREGASLDKIEVTLMAVYGHHFLHFKAEALKLKEKELAGQPPSFGWGSMKQKERGKLLDSIAGKAKKRMSQLAPHDFLMEKGKAASEATGALSDADTAFKKYYERYNELFIAGKKTSDCRAAAEKAVREYEKTKAARGKKPDYLKQAENMREQEAKAKEIQAFKDKCQAEDGIVVVGTTMKELEASRKQMLKDKVVSDKDDILRKEIEGIKSRLGEHYDKEFARLTVGKNFDALSYDDRRKLVHSARDAGLRRKEIMERHERMLNMMEYYVELQSRTAGMTPDQKEAYILTNFKEIDAAVALTRKKFYAQYDDAAKEGIAAINKKKNMTAAEKEEAIQKQLDTLEDKHAAAEAHKMGMGYTRVGRKTEDDKVLSSKDRMALINKQLYLLKKHEERYSASAEYSDEFDKLKEKNAEIERENATRAQADKKPLMSDAEMVKRSTVKASDAASGILKKGKKERLHYHGQQMLQAKIAKYKEMYPLFDAKYAEAVTGKDAEVKDPDTHSKLIKGAKEKAIKEQHRRSMIDSAAYRAAFNEGVLKTDKKRRKHATAALRHETNMQSADYEQMYNALSGPLTKEATARRRAEKHMRRMGDAANPAYKAGFEAATKSVTGTPSKSVLRDAREAARTSAKIARDTEEDKKRKAHYGEVYDTSRLAYGAKYADSATKSRKHAHERVKGIVALERHEKSMEANEGYKLAYETAIAAGSSHSDAREAALKTAKKQKKIDDKRAALQSQAAEEFVRYPDLQSQLDFYNQKYKDDPKKAYKSALASAKALQKIRGASTAADASIYDHPLFRATFLEAYEQTGDEKKAMEIATESVQKAVATDQRRKEAGKSVLANQEGVTAKQNKAVENWADSSLVKVVKKIRELNRLDPKKPESFVDKLIGMLPSKEKKATVDAQAPKAKHGESYGVGDGFGSGKSVVRSGIDVGSGMGGVKKELGYLAEPGARPKVGERSGGLPSVVKDLAPVQAIRGEVDRVAQKDGILGMAGGAAKGKLDSVIDGAVVGAKDSVASLLGPLMAAFKMGHTIVKYLMDKKKGLTTEETTRELLIKLMNFVPTIMEASNTVVGVITDQAISSVPIVGMLQRVVGLLAKLATNAIRLQEATSGAKEIHKNLKKSKSDLRDGKSKDVFYLKKGLADRKTRAKIDPTLVRNALVAEESKDGGPDQERVGKLRSWQKDHEFKRLFEKLIRERSIDIAQNVTSIAGEVSAFIPEFGPLVKAGVGLLNQSASFVRTGVREGKQVGREIAAARPTSFMAGIFDIDRSKANKYNDRAMFAVMVYNELSALPLPEDVPANEQERNTFLRDAAQRYRRMAAYTTRVWDMQVVLKASTKEAVLSAFIKSMAASSHSGG